MENLTARLEVTLEGQKFAIMSRIPVEREELEARVNKAFEAALQPGAIEQIARVAFQTEVDREIHALVERRAREFARAAYARIMGHECDASVTCALGTPGCSRVHEEIDQGRKKPGPKKRKGETT